MSTKKLPGLEELQIGNIFCIGRNYVEHAHELGNDLPEKPLVFLKPMGTIIFDGDTVRLPKQSSDVQHEVELVVAIGKTGKNIPKTQALDHVAGYGVGVDITARDIQDEAKEKSHPWTVAKGFDSFAPISSFVRWDKINDPQEVDLKITVNGVTRQSENTRLMIFPVAELIHYLSTIFTLQPGDLIFTGTPQGVSPLKSGDKIKASINNDQASLSVTVE